MEIAAAAQLAGKYWKNCHVSIKYPFIQPCQLPIRFHYYHHQQHSHDHFYSFNFYFLFIFSSHSFEETHFDSVPCHFHIAVDLMVFQHLNLPLYAIRNLISRNFVNILDEK